VIDAYTDHDDYMDEEDEGQDDDWQPGECDNCYGDTGETVVTNRPAGWTACACIIGQGASAEDCRCGPPAEGDPEALEREREIQRHA
jgi:hypothetical protein